MLCLGTYKSFEKKIKCLLHFLLDSYIVKLFLKIFKQTSLTNKCLKLTFNILVLKLCSEILLLF